jgi:hypothetical protein
MGTAITRMSRWSAITASVWPFATPQEQLPPIIASRPHDTLVGIDAAVVELEPIGEEAALEYLEQGASKHEAPARLGDRDGGGHGSARSPKRSRQ